MSLSFLYPALLADNALATSIPTSNETLPSASSQKSSSSTSLFPLAKANSSVYQVIASKDMTSCIFSFSKDDLSTVAMVCKDWKTFAYEFQGKVLPRNLTEHFTHPIQVPRLPLEFLKCFHHGSEWKLLLIPEKLQSEEKEKGETCCLEGLKKTFQKKNLSISYRENFAYHNDYSKLFEQCPPEKTHWVAYKLMKGEGGDQKNIANLNETIMICFIEKLGSNKFPIEENGSVYIEVLKTDDVRKFVACNPEGLEIEFSDLLGFEGDFLRFQVQRFFG